MTQGWQTHGRSVHDRKRKKARPRRVQQPQTGPAPATTSDAPDAPETPLRAGGAFSRSAAGGRSATWRSTPTPRQTPGQVIRPEEYHYVYSDLRRIGALAGVILVVLIALTFIIR